MDTPAASAQTVIGSREQIKKGVPDRHHEDAAARANADDLEFKCTVFVPLE